MVDLKAKGIENAAALLGGFVAWQNAGYPIDKNAAAAKPAVNPAVNPAVKK